MKKGTIFVTGGSGFLGSELLPVLVEAGYQVKAMVRSQEAMLKVKELGGIPVQGSMTDGVAALQRAIEGADLLIHAAAKIGFWTDKQSQQQFHQINSVGTTQVVQAAKAVGVKKAVVISTAAIVSRGKAVIRYDETMDPPDLPRDNYARTKWLGEKGALAQADDDFSVSIVRLPLIWGGKSPIVDRVVEQVKTGNFRWIGGGRQKMSTCHVKNVCAGTLAALQRGRNRQVYYLTDGEDTTLKQMFTRFLSLQDIQPGEKNLSYSVALILAHFNLWVWRVLNLKREAPLVPVMVYLMGQEFTLNDAKARKELGYLPVLSVDEGFAQLTKQYQNQ